MGHANVIPPPIEVSILDVMNLSFLHFEAPLSWCPNRMFNERSLVLFYLYCFFLDFTLLVDIFGDYTFSYL